MFILIDGINKKQVEEKAKELSNKLSMSVIDMSNANFFDWIQNIANAEKNTIFYNTFVSDQAESMITKSEPTFTTNEIIAIASQFAGKVYLEYLVDDDAEKMYEQSDKSLSLEEFKTRLISYNGAALSMKALMPVVPHKE